MNMTTLERRNAVIYGGGGSLGSAIAKALARAGANVFLTGRNLTPVKQVADEIVAAGGRAEAARVDATNGSEVDSLTERVARTAGTLDLSICAIDYQVVQNIPLVTMKIEDFNRPITLAMQSHFLTATAAGKIMMKQRSGVILSLTATPGGIGYPFTAGFAPACAAIESFSRNLASELGPYGVRVVNIRSGGSPDSQVFQQARNRDPQGMETMLRGMEEDTMLKRLPLMDDISNAAVFLAPHAAVAQHGRGQRHLLGPAASVTLFCTAPTGAYGPASSACRAAKGRCGRTGCARWAGPCLRMCRSGRPENAGRQPRRSCPCSAPSASASARGARSRPLLLSFGRNRSLLATSLGSIGKFEPTKKPSRVRCR
jgi:3-oxoacyl-[acyl-carrier protein] reductase